MKSIPALFTGGTAEWVIGALTALGSWLTSPLESKGFPGVAFTLTGLQYRWKYQALQRWRGPCTDTWQINKWDSLYHFFPGCEWLSLSDTTGSVTLLELSASFFPSCLRSVIPFVQSCQVYSCQLSEQGQPHENQVNISKNIWRVPDITCIWADVLIWRWAREGGKKSSVRLLVAGDDICQAVVPKNLNQNIKPSCSYQDISRS